MKIPLHAWKETVFIGIMTNQVILLIKKTLFHGKFYQHSIDLKLTKENDKENVGKLMKEKKNYATSQFYKLFLSIKSMC